LTFPRSHVVLLCFFAFDDSRLFSHVTTLTFTGPPSISPPCPYCALAPLTLTALDGPRFPGLIELETYPFSILCFFFPPPPSVVFRSILSPSQPRTPLTSVCPAFFFLTPSFMKALSCVHYVQARGLTFPPPFRGSPPVFIIDS